MTVHGLDISVYQEDANNLIQWDVLAKDPHMFRFIWVKCGEGEIMPGAQGAYPVNIFQRQMEGAASIGLKRGPYHFHYYQIYQGNGNYYHLNPTTQAQAFFAATQGQGAHGSYQSELPPLVDLEDPHIYNPVNCLAYSTSAGASAALAFARALNTGLRTYCEAVTQLFGRHPVIYTGAWWWNPWAHLIDNSTPADLNWLDAYQFYVADYAHPQPDLPIRAKNVIAWQYTSTPTPPVLGIPHGGALDCAQWLLPDDQFDAWAQGSGGVVTPPPPPPLTLEQRLTALENWAKTMGYKPS
jgi:GH25 family lysozyme M1 (1,4-beta-N-acetylmuramidase)